MSDLIDRQAAIDAISCDITVTGRQNAELVAATIGTFADRIKALPSVQPTIEPRKTGHWIPCSERLPKKNTPCLVASGKFCLTQIAMYSDLMGTIDRRIFYIGDYGKESFEDITKYVKAWMPLPPSYQGE